MFRRPRRSTNFPYTTLFRSTDNGVDGHEIGIREGHDRRALHAGDQRLDTLNRRGWGIHHDILLTPGIEQASEADEQILNIDRKSTRLNSSHRCISYAVFCLK